MSSTAAPRVIGKPLLQRDLEELARNGITQATAEQALLTRVDSFTGREIMGRNGSGNYAGILFPYIWPGETSVRDYRLRRDEPEVENGKPKNKYLSAPGRRNTLYFMPGSARERLEDLSLPILITEGEKKCLALWEVGWYGIEDAADRPAWLSIAISGVQNWRGKIGKVDGPYGERLDEMGPIPDLDQVAWNDRRVTILFDANLHSNNNVQIARLSLAKNLRGRGAHVFFMDIPADAGVNGVDDLVGIWGQDRVLDLITRASYDPQKKATPPVNGLSIDIDKIPSISSFDSAGIGFAVENLIALGSVNMISGESGHGKSTLALAIADTIAKGREFAGRRCCSPRRVLILDRENSIDAIQERFTRLHIKDESGLILWGGWLEQEAPMPAAPVVLGWIRKTEPKPVVIVDTLVAFLDSTTGLTKKHSQPL